jgi:site-specific DNA-methyltransferase (adenine-specific)
MKLIQGDCLVEMKNLIKDNVKVDLVLTDLPYGTTQCKWDSVIPFNKMWSILHKLTYKNSAMIFFGNEPFSSHLRLSNINEFKYDLLWDKIVRTGHLNANRQPLRQFENIMVFYEKQPKYNPIMWVGKEVNHPHKTTKKTTNVYGKHHEVPTKLTKDKYPTNIIKINARANECNNIKRVHPTQKPVELLEYLIETYTDKNDTVLDFTMGSGSTGVACKNLDRDFIGIEIDENYYNIAKERIYGYSN